MVSSIVPLQFFLLFSGCWQGFDFLSLSAGGGGVEAKNSVNRAGNGLDSLSQFQVPYLQSLAQKQTLMPFSMPQSRYTSSAYSDQLSVAPAAAHQVFFFLL